MTIQFKPDLNIVTASAPATSGNMAVGFDMMGFAISGLSDEVTLERRADTQLVLKAIKGVPGCDTLPIEIDRNVASAVIKKVLADLQLSVGFDVTLTKAIPVGSGLGGSAASSVAALTALNAFLEPALSMSKLLEYAAFGEQVATGQAHADNVAPSLLGGLTLLPNSDNFDVVRLPTPQLTAIMVHPHLVIETKTARASLASEVLLSDMVLQTKNLAGVICSAYQAQWSQLCDYVCDVVIEPQRAQLIPGFAAVKTAALNAGARAMSISGAGPTVFALCEITQDPQPIAQAMVDQFQVHGLASDVHIGPIKERGAEVLTTC